MLPHLDIIDNNFTASIVKRKWDMLDKVCIRKIIYIVQQQVRFWKKYSLGATFVRLEVLTETAGENVFLSSLFHIFSFRKVLYLSY